MRKSAIIIMVLAGAFAFAEQPASGTEYDASDVNPPTIAPPVDAGWIDQALVELITNGSFETGDFTGWDVFDAGDFGNWIVTNAAVGPISSNPLQPPSDGSFQAVVDQSGNGTHILWQDVTLPPGSSVTLNLAYWLENYNIEFHTPPTLDYTVIPNQQARIDIMDPAFPIDDVGAGVMQNIFITNPGDPPSVPPTGLSANLSAFAGQTIRLRFAEVDNQYFFNFAVDAVSIDAVTSTAVEGASWSRIKSLYR